MLNEHAQDLMFTPEESKPLVAVLPHPFHGRLVEKPMLMLTSRLNYKGQVYRLSWRDGGVAFYQPVMPEDKDKAYQQIMI